MKAVLKVAVAVLLILIILIAVIFFSANTLVRKGVEEVGQRSLGVEVELSKATISLLGGRLALTELRVSNPDGFSTDRLFETVSASAAVRPSALLQDELVIDSIIVDSPSLTIEQSLRGTNMATVLGNIQREGTAEEKPEKQKLYRIKMLQINGAEVTFASFLAAEAPVTVQLPDIQLEHISNADGTGMTLAQVFEKVFVKMIETALRTGEGVIPAETVTDVTDQLAQFAPELEVGLGDKAKGVIDKAGETLRGLFKR